MRKAGLTSPAFLFLLTFPSGSSGLTACATLLRGSQI